MRWPIAFRHKFGVRPDVNTQWPDARIYAHLTTEHCTLYIDTSGEPLFKRGWRADKGDAPLKETLAAAMLAASGWSQGDGTPANPDGLVAQGVPLYDPCCGSGTIAIEAAQIACNIAPGSMRKFGFQKLIPLPRACVAWLARQRARPRVRTPCAESLRQRCGVSYG